MVQTSASTRTVELITVDTALAAAKAGLKESQSLGVGVSTAVYNSLLTLIAFVDGDGATPHITETSTR